MMFRFFRFQSRRNIIMFPERVPRLEGGGGGEGKGGCSYMQATQIPPFSVTLSLRGGYQVQKMSLLCLLRTH